MLSPAAGTLGRTFPGKGRLGWGGDKKGGIGVGEGDLGDTMSAGDRLRWGRGKRGGVIGNGEMKDVVPSMEPVRPHAGVNMAGPPACYCEAGGCG